MTQAQTTPAWHNQEQQQPSSMLYFTVFSTLIVLVGAGVCVCCAAFTHQIFLALLLCFCLAGLSAWLLRFALKLARKDQQKLLTSLASHCQALLEGQSNTRILFSAEHKEQASQDLGKVLNHLFDNYLYLQKNTQARQQELARLHDQMDQLLYEIKPVLDGNLRTRSTVAGGALGSIAEICNTLVEDTAQLVQWAQYMSDQIIQTSHQLMSFSLEIAQIMETFARQHKATTEAIEALMALTLRTESTLFSNVHAFQDSWVQFQQQELQPGGVLAQGKTSENVAVSAQTQAMTDFFFALPRHINLLEILFQKTHETTALAEDTMKELHDVEQRFHRIDGTVVQFASAISSLATMADNWRQSADNYALPGSEEDAEEDMEAVFEAEMMLEAPLDEQKQLPTFTGKF